MARPIKGTTLLDRFLGQVEKTETCWLFKGAISNNGYGKLLGSCGKLTYAHRLSWEVHRGPIPEGVDVRHSCDVRHCVNPCHLFLGNYTIGTGTRHWKHILKEDDVAEVKRLLSEGTWSLRAIGARFGIHYTAISKIKTGANWKCMLKA